GIKRGDDVIIYGMGTYGQRLYDFIARTGLCKVVMCADRNYEALKRQGIDVVAPDEIAGSECNKIIVANSFYAVRNAIAKELTERYQDKEIITMDIDVVFGEDTLRRAGLK
ncbi:MAG: hypothetical protein K6F75_09860, partial [Butyrivibrio sp.]|nr:hypothetical protein [Butyrivibrio sp.]